MRKWLGLGVLAVAALGAIAYWQFSKTSDVVETTTYSDRVARRVEDPGHDGNAEASEVIEPLIVDRGMSQEDTLRAGEALRNYGRTIGATEEVPPPRVELAPGMKQAPRPDTGAPRMPYADEETFLPVPLDPLTWILDPTLPGLGIFEQLQNAGGAEESEPKGKQP